MTFSYPYTVRLADTDAAGVLYFAQLWRICHEAYEEQLVALGFDWSQLLQAAEFALPIAQGSADFLGPIVCGDRLLVTLAPAALSRNEFAVNYEIAAQNRPQRLLARARTRHVCIQRATRQRCDLPAAIAAWVTARAAP